jgi:hypothetical protein
VSAVTMADLTEGTRVRHVEWQMTGIVHVIDGITEIWFDNTFGCWVVSDEGPVFPSDLEIIGGAP